MEPVNRIFRDRKEAAVDLAVEIKKRIEALRVQELSNGEPKKRSLLGALSNPLVLGIPRGGVETAFWIAKQLDAELSVILTRKLGYPHQPELAFGAISEEGAFYMKPDSLGILTKEIIDSVMEIEQKELIRRLTLYRRGEPLPNLHGRFVILTDDGIATGATLFASLEALRKKHPAFIMIAIPVCSPSMKRTLESLVDSVVVLTSPHDFHSVSHVYEHFEGLNDHHVIRFLTLFREMHPVS